MGEGYPDSLPGSAMAPEVTREQLHAFLDDALSESESARVERTLRDSEELQKLLRQVIQERDRGEHTIGAIWRRQSRCPLGASEGGGASAAALRASPDGAPSRNRTEK